MAVVARKRPAPQNIRADCRATDVVGDFVSVIADSILGVMQVEKVDVTDLTTMPAIGVIEKKLTATSCLVQVAGIYPTTGLVAGVPYLVGINSQLSITPPVPSPAGLAVTQGVGSAISTTELLLGFDLIRIKRGLNT